MDRRAFLLGAMPAAALVGAGLERPWPTTPRSKEFLDAVQRGDVSRVRRMLAGDESLVYARDRSGRSAYVLAHLHRHEPVAQVLAEQGFVMDVVEAVLARAWERVDELAASSYEIVNVDHPIGGTAMYAAAIAGLGADLWRVQQYGGDPDANPRGDDGVTPARIALEHPDRMAALSTTATLLGNGATPNPPQRARSSILHGAAATGDVELVRLVLRKGGDPEARDDRDRRPIDVARGAGHGSVVTLLENHASVRRDHRSSRFAYTADGSPFVPHDLTGYDRRLIDRCVGSAHFDLEATRGTTDRFPQLAHAISASDEAAVEACAHTGRREVVELLLERGAPYSLPTALTMGDITTARRLLAEDAQRVDERGAHDFAVMWYPAIGGGSVEAAEILLDNGAELEQEYLGTTALHYAVRVGAEQLVTFLLAEGADANAVGHKFTPEGETPLDMAIERKHDGLAAQLRAAGGKVRADVAATGAREISGSA